MNKYSFKFINEFKPDSKIFLGSVGQLTITNIEEKPTKICLHKLKDLDVIFNEERFAIHGHEASLHPELFDWYLNHSPISLELYLPIFDECIDSVGKMVGVAVIMIDVAKVETAGNLSLRILQQADSEFEIVAQPGAKVTVSFVKKAESEEQNGQENNQ